jgi:regulator of sigma E protease
MLQTLFSIAGILITILFVIGTHEAAHFFTARALGVKVLRFSIGFGKRLFHWKDKQGTEYVFALIPLGGYVKMLDESEGHVPLDELPYAYNRQPFYKKFLIVLAGPSCNIVCAVLLYWLIFMIGFVSLTPIIGSILPKTIAAEAGLKANEEIVRVDGKQTLTWTSILFRLLNHYGDHDNATIVVGNNKTTETQTRVLELSNWHMNDLTPDPLISLGIVPYEPPLPLVIGMIGKNTAASSSQLKMGDLIRSVNHLPINDWDGLIAIISLHPDETVIFTIVRAGKTIELPVKIGSQRHWLLTKSGFLGIAPTIHIPKELLRKIQYGPVDALGRACQEVSNFIYFNLMLFGKLLTGKLPLQGLGGPITIFETAGTALNQGLISFLNFLAFLSVSIGVINLFPVPGLDGGHLFLQFVEFVIRRQIPSRLLDMLYRFGLLLILFVLIQALANDILRITA